MFAVLRKSEELGKELRNITTNILQWMGFKCLIILMGSSGVCSLDSG